jgi:glutathione S-transferase
MADSDVIRLHVFASSWAINPSPFCLKIETYCRLAKIPFDLVPSMPFRAPRGKLPFMTDGKRVVPDSGLIIEHLARTRGIDLDARLDSDQRAIGHLVRRTCEESLYFVLVYSRWIDPAGWQVVEPVFFGSLPPVVRTIVPVLARRGVRRSLIGQGYGRHRIEEVYALGGADLAAIAGVLGKSKFAAGPQPSSFDAGVYGVLANIIAAPVDTPLKQAALRHPELCDYVSRVGSL